MNFGKPFLSGFCETKWNETTIKQTLWNGTTDQILFLYHFAGGILLIRHNFINLLRECSDSDLKKDTHTQCYVWVHLRLSKFLNICFKFHRTILAMFPKITSAVDNKKNLRNLFSYSVFRLAFVTLRSFGFNLSVLSKINANKMKINQVHQVESCS